MSLEGGLILSPSNVGKEMEISTFQQQFKDCRKHCVVIDISEYNYNNITTGGSEREGFPGVPSFIYVFSHYANLIFV